MTFLIAILVIVYVFNSYHDHKARKHAQNEFELAKAFKENLDRSYELWGKEIAHLWHHIHVIDNKFGIEPTCRINHNNQKKNEA